MDKGTKFIQIGNQIFNENWKLIDTSETCIYTDNCPFLVSADPYCKYYDRESGVCMYLFAKAGVKILFDIVKHKEIFDDSD